MKSWHLFVVDIFSWINCFVIESIFVFRIFVISNQFITLWNSFQKEVDRFFVIFTECNFPLSSSINSINSPGLNRYWKVPLLKEIFFNLNSSLELKRFVSVSGYTGLQAIIFGILGARSRFSVCYYNIWVQVVSFEVTGNARIPTMVLLRIN